MSLHLSTGHAGATRNEGPFPPRLAAPHGPADEYARLALRRTVQAVVRAHLGVVLMGAAVSLAAPASTPVASFRVEVQADGRVLSVEASFPAPARRFVVEDGGDRFLRDVEVKEGGRWVSIQHPEQSIDVAACANGCRLRYRFLVKEAAETLADPQAAGVFAGGYVSPPST
jgi:hypothetical protein